VTEATNSTCIWNNSGQEDMLPLVCNGAAAILFVFDMSRKSTLDSIKGWYKQARVFNRTALPFLIGTKYDLFLNLPPEEQDEITKQAAKFAKAMKGRFMFCSASHGIGVQRILKEILKQLIPNEGDFLLSY